MTDIRLCKDCKHYRKSWLEHILMGTDRYDMCVKPDEQSNFVTGKPKHFCDVMRSEKWVSFDWTCGPVGKHWVAK